MDRKIIYSPGAAFAGWATWAIVAIAEGVRHLINPEHKFPFLVLTVIAAVMIAVNSFLRLCDRINEVEHKLDAILEKLNKR